MSVDMEELKNYVEKVSKEKYSDFIKKCVYFDNGNVLLNTNLVYNRSFEHSKKLDEIAKRLDSSIKREENVKETFNSRKPMTMERTYRVLTPSGKELAKLSLERTLTEKGKTKKTSPLKLEIITENNSNATIDYLLESLVDNFKPK
ncbi:MAG: hypothetical protein JW700_01025 [Candidatus Aenigmarchaeota archaeon]|nr:hypothetical protein [Candidatus Aenigmarchaeota archaeon]